MSTGRNAIITAFHGQASESADISVSDTSSPTLMRSRQVDVCADMVVRRLTPLECERLQGFPDYWTLIGKPIGYEKYTFTDTGKTWIDTIYEYTDSKGKKRKTSDSARYKALGNSIAIPPWTYVLSRLRRYLPENATIASLFDGIGGFSLIGMRVGIKPVWASEIEEFCIAVAKERFKED